MMVTTASGKYLCTIINTMAIARTTKKMVKIIPMGVGRFDLLAFLAFALSGGAFSS